MNISVVHQPCVGGSHRPSSASSTSSAAANKVNNTPRRPSTSKSRSRNNSISNRRNKLLSESHNEKVSIEWKVVSNKPRWVDTPVSRAIEARVIQNKSKRAKPTDADTAVVTPSSDKNKSIANALRQKYERLQLRSVFRHWDTDKDGFISKEEVKKALAHRGIFSSNRTLNELFKAFDSNSDGRISFTEFSEYILDEKQKTKCNKSLNQSSQENNFDQKIIPSNFTKKQNVIKKIQKKLGKTKELSRIFKSFDSESSGKISRYEFHVGLQSLGIFLSSEDIQLLLGPVRKQRVSLREFENLFSTTSTSKKFDFNQPLAGSSGTSLRTNRFSSTPRGDKTKDRVLNTNSSSINNCYKSESSESYEPICTRPMSQQSRDKKKIIAHMASRHERIRRNTSRVESSRDVHAYENSCDRRVYSIVKQRIIQSHKSTY